MTSTPTTTVIRGSFTVTSIGVCLVLLKLCGWIDWSWWLISLPFWYGPIKAIIALTWLRKHPND